jgi:uncharacterized protein involved in outer membrane biogenesis
MRFGTVLKIIAVVVVALVVAAVAVVASIDVNQYKGRIIALVKTATGRDLTLEGDLEMSIGLSPAVVVNGARLSNAVWAGAEDMMAVDRVEAEVALIPALFGDIEVKRLIIVKPTIIIATKGGKTNLTFEPPAGATAAAAPQTSPPAAAEPGTGAEGEASAGGMPALPAIGEVRIEDGRVIFRDLDAGSEEVLALDLLSAEADNLSAPLDLVLRGSYGEVAFDLTGRVGAPNTLGSGTPFPVALAGTAAGITLSVDGTIADPMAVEGLDLKLSVQADDLDGLAPLAGDLPALPPLSVKGHLTGGGQSFTLADLDLTAGKSKVTGTAGVALGGARPKADLRLQAALLDLDELLPEGDDTAAGGDGAAGAGGGAKGGTGGRVIPDTPLPLDGLKAADATFDVAVAKLVLPGGMEVDGLSAKGALANGRLTLAPLAARMGDGTLSANATVDASSGKSAAVTARIKADKVVLGTLFEQISRSDLLTGAPTDADIQLTGAGATPAAIAGSLDGSILVTIGDGRVNEAVIDWAGADVLTQLADSLDPDSDPYATLTCGVVKMGAKDGVLTWDEQVAFQTSKMNVLSSGVIDLGPETLDIAVHPSPRAGVGISAGKLAELVRLTGTLSHPSVGLDTAGLARNAASVAGALATGGMSLLAEKMLDSRSSSDDPCAVALGAAPKAASGGSSSSGEDAAETKEPATPEEFIKDFGKGLGGLLGR